MSAAGTNLALRIVSAAVLAPLALLAAYAGGWLFGAFWGVAAALVLWEWIGLVEGPLWIAAGLFYAAVMVVAPVVLRTDAEFGFAVMVLLFAVVWSTDIFGYFAGRAIGGPKLLPAVSPKKTWAGAVAGAAGAVAVTVLAARWFGLVDLGAIAAVALVLSVVSQSGDLLESWIKRRFGAKDASHLIPGHGGVMDRLDGFWAAALVGAAIGLARGGLGAAARGLLLW
ncbi:MAG TPA: phosphatidate cytidylyltransferase [Pseudolabrys sp.]|nr:phosphatidate cytidylyltransferase [Pseudolabrys sp.]